MPMSNTGGNTARPVGARARDPVHVRCFERRAAKLLARTDNNSPFRPIELQYIERDSTRDSQPPSLADGVSMEPAMTSEHAAARIDDVALVRNRFEPSLDEVCRL